MLLSDFNRFLFYQKAFRHDKLLIGVSGEFNASRSLKDPSKTAIPPVTDIQVCLSRSITAAEEREAEGEPVAVAAVIAAVVIVIPVVFAALTAVRVLSAIRLTALRILSLIAAL